jgi:hypothetical protein
MNTVGGVTTASEVLREFVLSACAPRVVGVEREYTVHDADGVIDGRALWPELRALGAAIDPSDVNARRGPWGGAVTLDGAEMEVATPPFPLVSGVTGNLLTSASAGQRYLGDRLPSGNYLKGYSTHLNVEVDDAIGKPLARLIATRLALPLMLVIDRRHSPGVLVRPRHGRLEIGGEFLAGRQLKSATVMAVATVMLGERALRDRSLRRTFRSTPRLVPDRAVERYGWFAGRGGFGCDLYAAGASTRLRLHRASIEARSLLAAHWERARPFAEQVLAERELLLVDRQIDGDDPLPLEVPIDVDHEGDCAAQQPLRVEQPTFTDRSRSYAERHRDNMTVSVTAATWWRASIEIRYCDRTRWLIIPGRALDAMLDALDDDRLWNELMTLARADSLPSV